MVMIRIASISAASDHGAMIEIIAVPVVLALIIRAFEIGAWIVDAFYDR